MRPPSSRGRRAQELFEQATEVDESQRVSWLLEHCGSDDDLRGLVEALLAADDITEGFLEAPFPGPTHSTIRNDGSVRGQIGPYEVLGKIGQGGTSLVYLGQRSDRPWDRRVALKVLRESLLDSFQADRIMQEAGMLAQLSHPYIATLLDASRTDGGRPYLVTDYVQGRPIHEYCDSRQLPIRDRVELFLKVCEAVTYAHQNLVIHRDIKPANLLIQEDGIPKLLDFGLAKLLEPIGSTASTTAVRMLTPNYASPEHLAGDRVTTASDTYSLGVVLFELLTATKPRDWSGASVYTILARFRDESTNPMSESLPGGATDLDRVAVNRSTSTKSLSRLLKGDLDRIAKKALEVDPDLRYSAPADLARDLRRYLSGLPVSAGSAPPLYRLGKFCRRHAVLLINVLLIAALLFGSTIVATVQATRLKEERNQARLSEARADEVTNFLIGVFGYSDPFRGNTTDLSAREVLDAGAARIETEMSDQPDLRAELRSAIGVVYSRLREFEAAQALLEKALQDGEQGLTDPIDRSRTMLELAEVRLELGDLEAAETDLLSVLQLAQSLEPEEGSIIGDTHRQLAEVRSFQGQHGAAAEYARKAIEFHTKYSDPLSDDIPFDLNVLLSVLYRSGDLSGAEEAGRRAFDILQNRPNPDEASLANLLGNFATVLGASGRTQEAEKLHRQTLEIRQRVFGDDHPLTANTLNNFASLLSKVGREAEAVPLLIRAYEINRKIYEESHPIVVANLNNRAKAHYQLGHLDEALEVGAQALELIRHDSLQDRPWTVTATLHTHGRTLLDLQQLPEAEALIVEDLALREAKWSEDSPTVATSVLALARLQQAKSSLDEAELTYEKFMAAATVAWEADHWYPAWGATHFAGLLFETGQPAKALPLIEEAYQRLGELLPDGHYKVAVASNILEAVRSSETMTEGSVVKLRESYLRLLQVRGEQSLLTHQARERLTRLGIPVPTATTGG